MVNFEYTTTLQHTWEAGALTKMLKTAASNVS